jgi:negative regulator of flagellin synthesis FlgM
MNIDKIMTNSLTGTTTAKPGKADKAKGGESSVAASSSDKVSLTSTGSALNELGQRVSNSTGVDRAKVDAIRTALKNGTYPFNPDRIAQKMLDMEQWLR